jgi:alkaline phosphatase D
MKPLQTTSVLTAVLLLSCAPLHADAGGQAAARPTRAGVHFGNGIKIGEVDATSAIVWLRLTDAAERRANGTPFKDDDDKVPEGLRLGDMQGSLMGAAGKVLVRYQTKDGTVAATPWHDVDPQRDFTTQIRLTGLTPATAYTLTAEGRAPGEDAQTAICTGGFTTAPLPSATAPVRFVVVTGHEFPRRDDGDRGHRIYSSMPRLDPHFFVHTGDIEYYDKPGPWAKSTELARFKWNRIYSLENQRGFHCKVASYFMKDDHDTLKNDCWPGQTYGDLTWDQGLAIFREQVPMGENTHRTFRWGTDLQVWLVEGRDFRSPNNMPDGPEKSILGAAQKKWLFDTMRASDAAFRILISPTPIIGPDRGEKNDNLANKGFTHEGNEVRAFLATLPGAFVICGDRHWQYVSRDPASGLTEFSCGPGSDLHAGGFSLKNRGPEHRFLRIKGGFLSVDVERSEDQPRISFRHHDVNGGVVHEESFTR